MASRRSWRCAYRTRWARSSPTRWRSAVESTRSVNNSVTGVAAIPGSHTIPDGHGKRRWLVDGDSPGALGHRSAEAFDLDLSAVAEPEGRLVDQQARDHDAAEDLPGLCRATKAAGDDHRRPKCVATGARRRCGAARRRLARGVGSARLRTMAQSAPRSADATTWWSDGA